MTVKLAVLAMENRTGVENGPGIPKHFPITVGL